MEDANFQFCLASWCFLFFFEVCECDAGWFLELKSLVGNGFEFQGGFIQQIDKTKLRKYTNK